MTTDELAQGLADIKRLAATACGIIPSRKSRPIPSAEDRRLIRHTLGTMHDFVSNILRALDDEITDSNHSGDDDVVKVLRGFQVPKDKAVEITKRARARLGADAKLDDMIRESINIARGV